MEQQLIVDRYRPLEDLGEGAFGSVVLAWDTRMQRRVAIKRLPLPLDERGRPHRPPGLAEARTAAMLNHPNIVTVFDFDTDADEAFLVMEHVDGASLAELLDDVGGPLDADEAASVIGDVSSALEFAHRNGVLHLDIKPENVLIGRDGRAKVADFGIAELSSLAGHGSAFGGTPGYMPVEQLAGEEVSERTDEWALAALAFETMTGENPFAAPKISLSARELEVFEPPAATTLEPALPREVDDVLLAALSPASEERYPTVAQFTDALLGYLGDADAGCASLADLVEAYAEDEADDEGLSLSELGLWDRLQGPIGSVLVRAAAGLEAGWLASTGFAPFRLESPALLGAVALVALAALFAPGLGIGLGLGCFIAGLARAGAWWSASIVLLAGGAWWWLVARRSASASVLPLSAPVLATVRAAFLQPLLAGFTLPPLRAALTALLGGALTMLASAASGHAAPYLAVWPGYALDVWHAGAASEGIRSLVTSPAAYMALLGWPAAAAFMSLLCRRATRPFALLGAVGASGLLALSYFLAERIAETMGSGGGYVSVLLGVVLGVSLILVTLVASLGAPVRAEEEDPFRVADIRLEDD